MKEGNEREGRRIIGRILKVKKRKERWRRGRRGEGEREERRGEGDERLLGKERVERQQVKGRRR